MKNCRRIVITLLLVMVVLFFGKQSSQAKNVWVSKMSSGKRAFTVSFAEKTRPKQVQLLNKNGKAVSAKYVKRRCSFSKLKRNKLYFYRYRFVEYDQTLGGYKATSGWSSKKPVTTFNIKLKKADDEIIFKAPRVAGIKKYRLYVSTKRLRGYRKIKTFKPGAKVKVEEVKGKDLQDNKFYFFRIAAITKNGKKAENYYNIYNHYFYIDED